MVMNNTDTQKYFFLALFAIILVLAVAIVWPFITTILTSLVMAYVLFPVYQWLLKKTKRKNLSAMIVSLIIIMIVIVAVAFILFSVSKEARIGYIIIKQKIAASSVIQECTGFVCKVINSLKEVARNPEAKFYIENSLNKISSSFAESSFSFIFSLPSRILEILLTFFFTFFLLRDGKEVVKKIEKNIPLRDKYKSDITNQVHEVLHGVIFGFFIIAIIEGIIAAITFKLFGVASPMLWGMAIAFLAFIPFVGGAVVWIPAMIIQFNNGSVGFGIGILFGGLIITYIDMFIKPKVIGEKSAVHPAIILIGLLGGLKLIGLIGIVLGPIILALFITLVKTFAKKR